MRVMKKTTLGKILKIAIFAFGIFETTPADACHRFSRWYYPYPQRCSVVTPNNRIWYVEITKPPSDPTLESIYPPEIIYKLNELLTLQKLHPSQ